MHKLDTLWLQDKVRAGAVEVRKVAGEVNPADIFTKHLPSREKVHQLMSLFGCEYREGRAKSAPMLKKKTPMTSIDELPGGDDIEMHVIRDLDESREVGQGFNF